MSNIVFLDTETIGKVNNMKLLSKLGELETYNNTAPDQVVERCKGKDIIIVNKVRSRLTPLMAFSTMNSAFKGVITRGKCSSYIGYC